MSIADAAAILHDLKQLASEASDHTDDSFRRGVTKLANRAHALAATGTPQTPDPTGLVAFKLYLNECDECCIEPDVAGAFCWAWRADRADLASQGAAPAEPWNGLKGLPTLRSVIGLLRETGRYVDEEGESTDCLNDLAAWVDQQVAGGAAPTGAGGAEPEHCKHAAIREATAYCIGCEKEGHRTDECHSTSGFNSPRDMEISRLAWIANGQMKPFGDAPQQPADAALGGDRAFEYLLNAFEQASQAPEPAKLDYKTRRAKLFAYVRRLEATKAEAEPGDVQGKGDAA